jgi:dolichol-phosphate mannosyltransferase
MKRLTAIPVYNEERHLESVLQEVRKYSERIVVVNDGSTDRTGELLGRQQNLAVITHEHNRGYGAALISAFQYALGQDIDVLVTMDCDGQHEPSRIPVLLEAIHDADIVSGSRYLRDFRQDALPTPQDRQRINAQITADLNERLGLNLTDAFCGFKAYRTTALAQLRITEAGWGMPLQLWVQAACRKLRIKEVGVPRIYLDPNRAFGGVLNDAGERLAYYRRVIAEALANENDGCRGELLSWSCQRLSETETGPLNPESGVQSPFRTAKRGPCR